MSGGSGSTECTKSLLVCMHGLFGDSRLAAALSRWRQRGRHRRRRHTEIAPHAAFCSCLLSMLLIVANGGTHCSRIAVGGWQVC